MDGSAGISALGALGAPGFSPFLEGRGVRQAALGLRPPALQGHRARTRPRISQGAQLASRNTLPGLLNAGNAVYYSLEGW